MEILFDFYYLHFVVRLFPLNKIGNACTNGFELKDYRNA